MNVVNIGIFSGLAGIGLAAGWIFSIYRIVPAGEAHYVVSPSKRMVCAPNEKLRDKEGGRAYFAFPSFLPIIGRQVTIVDTKVKELLGEQETYEKGQARYKVRYSLKYVVSDAAKAAETFADEQDLQKQLEEQVKSAVRAITVKYDVVEARANKQKMADEVKIEIEDDLAQWGLNLTTFALVDFQDTGVGDKDSKIITNISRRREVDIESSTRQENAQKLKEARLKEAEAEEEAKKREIMKEENIAKREQEKLKAVAEKSKETREQELEVTKVNFVKQASIDKEKAVVFANQQKEVQEILKEQKKLEGEGERLRLEALAVGEVAKIKEALLAEATGKAKLQEVLSKFDDKAIRALVAEKVVAMQQIVGVAAAAALEKADMKVFVGEGGKEGFDFGKLIESIAVSSNGLGQSVLNRLARPNDLGLSNLTLVAEGKKEAKEVK